MGELKWCTACKARHERTAFGRDRTRGDGLAAHCLASRRTGKPRGWQGRRPINPLTGKPGPAPSPPRDGDRRQARQRVNVEVRTGRRPHPNTLPCVDCGHVWAPGERRHEYDHYLGYAAEHHLDVQPVCTKCHAKRDAFVSHCHRGHEFTDSNTIWKQNGTRGCRECRRIYDKRRTRPPGYWKEVNRRRRERAAT